jgi:hypothetical protein
MTAIPNPQAARRLGEPRFLVYPAPLLPGAAPSSLLGDVLKHTVRRVRIEPDPESIRSGQWPSYDGFAVLDRETQELVRLFVIEPESRAFLEWQLDRVDSPLTRADSFSPAAHVPGREKLP